MQDVLKSGQAMFSTEILSGVRIHDRTGVRNAAIVLRDAVMGLSGLKTAVCHDISSPQPMRDADGGVLASSVFGFPAGEHCWWMRPQLALLSPLTAACRLEAEPFWCNDKGYRTHVFNPALERIDLTDFEARALTKAAIVVPLHLPFGRVAAASLLSPDATRDDLSQEYEAFADVLAIYLRQFITSYVQVMRPEREAGAEPTLSKREVECLRWAAAGKTNDEIALILKLTRSTVRFHIRNAAEKLDAVNRDQTVFKATQLGYLGAIR